MNRFGILVIFCVLFLRSLPAWADNWPQFRGPESNQLPDEAELPLVWSEEEHVLWKWPVPGRGWSSPIVWGDRVFVSTALTVDVPVSPAGTGDGEREDTDAGPGGEGKTKKGIRLEVYCLDLDSGKVLWNRVAFEGVAPVRTHTQNTYASETPATDGERVYVYFGMMGIYAYDLDGNLVWEKDLGAYPMQSNWGTGSSPLLFGDSLYLQIDNEEDSFIVALDTKTGNERWRKPRDEKSNWSSPIIWKNRVRTELVTGGGKVRSYDPKTGDLYWELNAGRGRNVSSPAGNDEMLYVGNEPRDGGGDILFAVPAGASGDVTPAEGESTSAGVAWSEPEAGLSMASPLLYRGFLYLANRRGGVLSCYHAETGESAYRAEELPGGNAIWASSWAFDGKVFCLDEGGTTHVLEAGGELKVLYRNELNDKFWASPALAHGSIVLRGVDHLYCIRESE